MSKVYRAPEGKGTAIWGAFVGIGVAALLFLAIPLTQLFTQYEKAPKEIHSLEVAPPAPPPPIEEPPPPPEPEQEEPPPELDTPPPPISLEALEMSLNPGTGGSLTGDFALPGFNVNQKELGGLEIFDVGDVDEKPQPKKQPLPRFPGGSKGYVIVQFVVDAQGKTTDIVIVESSNKKLERPATEAIRKWLFAPGKKDNRTVLTKTRQRFNI